MFGSLVPVGTALATVSDFVGAIADIFGGVAFFTGGDFAAALARGFMA